MKKLVAEANAELKEGMAKLETNQAELKEGMAKVESKVTAINLRQGTDLLDFWTGLDD